MKIEIPGEFPAVDELIEVLGAALPQYEVKKGWGVVDWVLVKKSFFIAIGVCPSKKKGCVTLAHIVGTRAAIPFWMLLGGPLWNLFVGGTRKKMKAEIRAALEHVYAADTAAAKEPVAV